jgi:hypothetical protein
MWTFPVHIMKPSPLPKIKLWTVKCTRPTLWFGAHAKLDVPSANHILKIVIPIGVLKSALWVVPSQKWIPDLPKVDKGQERS